MLKALVVATIAAIPLLFNAGQVRAQHSSVNGVQCPLGTCGGTGGSRASEVKYCKPSNCRKGTPK